LGRNFADYWATFNGDIGDMYLYTAALSDAERGQLEAYLEKKLIGGNTVGSPAPRAVKPALATAPRARRAADGRWFPERGRKAAGKRF
jgi:hypothetical protein